MRLLVWLVGIPAPRFARKRALAQLFSVTASAFEVEAPTMAGLDAAACLALYARYTHTWAEERLRDGREVEAVRRRLYRNALELGSLCRRRLRPRTARDVMAIARALYRLLEIDFRGDAAGEVVIARCYFSRVYSCAVCQLMSAVDRGLLAGLAGGGDLTFSARITEGQPCCLAQLSWPDEGAPQAAGPVTQGQ